MRDREPKVGPPAEGAARTDSRAWTGTARQTIGGRYRLSAPLGRGGMGEVWQAEHLVTGRNVAIKLLNRNLSERVEMRHRFLREARAATKVHHPNVIEVLDAFEDDGLLAFVMPLLEGEVLSRFLRREGPLSLDDALNIFLPLVSAVGAAHAQGIVHRDLKPDNVFLVNDGVRRHVKVLDFGIAKLMNPTTVDGATVTATGSPLGTLWYMAPEQCLGDSKQNHLVDVWALGVILYELLSGRRPIDGQNLAQVMKASLMQPIRPLEELVPAVPRDVAQLTLQMLSHQKAARPQTLQAVYERLLEHVPPEHRRDWQRAQRDDTLKWAGAPSSSRQRAALGNASTVELLPTDHAMLSSVRPPARFWSRHVGLGVGLASAAALVFFLARRAPVPAESAPPVAATPALTATPSPTPLLVEAAPPSVTAPRLAPTAVRSATRPVAKASKRVAVVKPLAAAAPATVEAKPDVARTEGAPRQLDTANPFSPSGSSAASRSFAP